MRTWRTASIPIEKPDPSSTAATLYVEPCLCFQGEAPPTVQWDDVPLHSSFHGNFKGS